MKMGYYIKATQPELKATLNRMEYKVTQECGTEPAFANAYWNDKEAGIYVDVVSGEPLFNSKAFFLSDYDMRTFVN